MQKQNQNKAERLTPLIEMRCKKPLVILTSPSGSLASDLFWPGVWEDLVKISRGEQRTESEQIFFFKFWTANIGMVWVDKYELTRDE